MAKTVLLIEDEIYLNDLYKMTLEADGYTVLAISQAIGVRSLIR